MIAVDTFLKIVKICRIEPDLKTYKHCRIYPHPLFTEDDDIYEEDTHDEICPCCVEKKILPKKSWKKKKV